MADMNTLMQNRLEKFATCFVQEFDMYNEVQRIIIKDAPSPNSKLKEMATDSINELIKSPEGVVGATLGHLKDYVLNKRKLDIAGKMINLVDKYQNVEEKKAIREMLVRVAYELFRSYEYQFMQAEKTVGGWSEAMVQLARAAVWCFMHSYKFNNQKELDEKYVLEGITLKNMPKISIWKKWYYADEKKFTKVKNMEEHTKFDGVKMFSKAGIRIDETGESLYYINDVIKPQKYGFRRVFTHENHEIIKSEYKEIQITEPISYKYQLDMGTATKENICAEILEKINSLDDSLMEDRLLENMKRIIEDIVENLMCEFMQQMVATLNGIVAPVASSTSTVNNATTNNEIYQPQTADKIQNILKRTFQGTVNMNL